MNAQNGRILPDLSTLGRDQLEALVAGLQAKVQASQRKVTLKVTEKGGVSMYGLGRFPVTLYKGQWERLLNAAEDIKAFLEANSDCLSVKE